MLTAPILRRVKDCGRGRPTAEGAIIPHIAPNLPVIALLLARIGTVLSSPCNRSAAKICASIDR
jgi:hypothetical protein